MTDNWYQDWKSRPLVERLEKLPRGLGVIETVDLCREAASRIEALEAALATFAYDEELDISDLRKQWEAANPGDYDEVLVPAGWVRTARRALKGSK